MTDKLKKPIYKKSNSTLRFLKDHTHEGMLIKKGTLLSDVSIQGHTLKSLIAMNVIKKEV